MSYSAERFTDSGQAAAACREALKDQFIHVAGLGWLAYDGRRWAEVPDKVPLAAVRRWTTAQVTAALVPGNGDEFKAWVKRLDAPKLKNALQLCEGFDGISVEPDRLDRRPDILNCRNGIVHLPTGDLVPHDPGLYLTKCTEVDYDPSAKHPDWDAALEAIPESVRGWLQTRYGQGITGYACPDDRMVVQQGGGSNGKSTVLAGLGGALGDYYHQAPSRLLVSAGAGGHSADLADLRGTRFVAIEETPESGRLDVVLLKTLAGTPRISARKLYRDPVSFPATHTLFLNTNYTPIVGETDEGTWRRLLLVVFPYRFTAAPLEDLDLPGDPRLRERIGGEEQARAALAWLVEGATRWFAQGREFGPAPAMVDSDTDEWRFEADLISTYWADHLDPDPDSFVHVSDLVWHFNQYLARNGNSKLAGGTFRRRFENHTETRGAQVARKKVKQWNTALSISRPAGALDPFSRLPGAPVGNVWAWVGVKFRRATDDGRDLGGYISGSTGSTSE